MRTPDAPASYSDLMKKEAAKTVQNRKKAAATSAPKKTGNELDLNKWAGDILSCMKEIREDLKQVLLLLHAGMTAESVGDYSQEAQTERIKKAACDLDNIPCYNPSRKGGIRLD